MCVFLRLIGVLVRAFLRLIGVLVRAFLRLIGVLVRAFLRLPRIPLLLGVTPHVLTPHSDCDSRYTIRPSISLHARCGEHLLAVNLYLTLCAELVITTKDDEEHVFNQGDAISRQAGT
jgi:hypothetical protein